MVRILNLGIDRMLNRTTVKDSSHEEEERHDHYKGNPNETPVSRIVFGYSIIALAACLKVRNFECGVLESTSICICSASAAKVEMKSLDRSVVQHIYVAAWPRYGSGEHAS